MSLKRYIFLRRLIALSATVLFVQSSASQVTRDLSVFGYFQGNFRYGSESITNDKGKLSSYSLQQLNLLFRKEFGSSFSSFVNMESLNTYSSADGWGSLKFSEAWVRYNHDKALNIKVGLQIPTFNNLNDIKNRTPLLPYILRPAVYESSYETILPISAFVPRQAFFEIDGVLSASSLRIDYAFYIGNEDEFLSTEYQLDSSIPVGADTTTSKLLGGRVGIRYNELKAGVSATYDHSNQTALNLPAVPRYRLGLDLSFSVRQAFFESEAIWVRHGLSDSQHELLVMNTRTDPLLTSDLDKFFVYGMAGYRLNDQISIYGAYNFLRDRSFIFWSDGFNACMGGLVYKPVDAIVFKAQYIYANLTNDGPIILEYKGNFLFGGLSVLF